jgi:hypothetical protein
MQSLDVIVTLTHACLVVKAKKKGERLQEHILALFKNFGKLFGPSFASEVA